MNLSSTKNQIKMTMIEPLSRNSLSADPLKSNYERDNREYELLGLNSVRIGKLSLRHCLIDSPL
jgi:hypothetical protein